MRHGRERSIHVMALKRKTALFCREKGIHCRAWVRTIYFGAANQVHLCGGYFYYKLCELLNAFVWRYRDHFWFNPYKQNTALWFLCIAKSGYWQNHVGYILTTNASTLVCEGPSPACIIIWCKVFCISIKICQRSSNNFMLILWYTLWNLAASRLHEICQQDVLLLIEQRPPYTATKDTTGVRVSKNVRLRYQNCHHNHKLVARSSYLYNWNVYTEKMTLFMETALGSGATVYLALDK